MTSLKQAPNAEAIPLRPTIAPGVLEPVLQPWSISNRYYDAEVHFALHTVSRVYGPVFEGVPAVIVAWSEGEVRLLFLNAQAAPSRAARTS